MAIIIRHGANGSYKSAVIVFNHIIKALRKGEIVVTNMEGMYPIPHLEKSLGKKFPDSARLVRIGSLTSEKKELWQNWFSWMPLGAVVVIDEVQSIYKKSFKGGLLLRPIDDFKELLPQSLIDIFHERKKSIKATDFDAGDTDDTGELRFNLDGSIIYPDTLEDSFERHRKYNWDIIFGTPDIKQIATNIRACAETAFAHKSKDAFILTKRRPRIFEHDPNVNGTSPKKEDCSSIKVPLWAFLCYKSTQTNKQTKSGQGNSPLKNPKFILIMGVCCVSIYMLIKSVNDIFFNDPSPANEVIESPVTPLKSSPQTTEKTRIADLEIHQNDSNKSDGVRNRISLLSSASTGNSNKPDLILPFNASSIYLTGYAHPSIYIFKVTFINGQGDEETAQINSDDLALYGWVAKLENDGLVQLKNRLTEQMIYTVYDPFYHPEFIEDEDPIYNNYDPSEQIASLPLVD